MDVFTIKDLTFIYPQRSRPSLSNISLSIGKGEFIALCGQSGSGKTTLMRLLKPALAPHGEQSGEILYRRNGARISSSEWETEVGFVLQNPENQIVTDKVWHELAFGPENLGWDNETIRVRVAEMASYFGIHSWFRREVKDLSGGEKQLLNLAAVMVMNPKVLLLDEPTSQLDPIAAEDFLDTVRKLNREIGTTVVITEHRLDYLLPEADRILVLDKGRLIVDDTPAAGAARLAEMDHDMFSSMPAVTKAYAMTRAKGLPAGDTAPLDIRQGRKWLEDLLLKGDHSGETAGVRKINEPISPDRTANPTPEEAQASKPALTGKNLWFRYDRNGEDVLRGLNLAVNQGEVFAIVGGNGSGKSTLLKILCGMQKAYRGKIRTFGEQKILMLPQDPQSVFACETVRGELEEMTGDREKIREVADLMAITDLLEAHPYDISGGEQQRTALAKVLLADPDILLMDEPTKGIDNAFKMHIGETLGHLKEQGKTIVLVSHDIEFCALYADRCAMIFDGAITAAGTARKLFSGNRFYTTSCSKMSEEFFDNAVVPQDIAELLELNLKD